MGGYKGLGRMYTQETCLWKIDLDLRETRKYNA